MPVALEKIVEEIKTLSPQERQRLREMLDSEEMPEDDLQRRREEVYQRLRDKGIVVRIPLPITDPRPFDEWQPIKIEGKPLSETIIEERR